MPEAGSAPGGPPFVGRRTESAALTSVLSRLEKGRGGLALVTGGAGIGKSRLVAATLERLLGRVPVEGAGATMPARVRVGYGECLPDLLMPPLWPISRAVSSAAVRQRRATGEDPLDPLTQLLRPTANGADPDAPSAGPGWDRLAVLGDVVDRLVAAADAQPLVLVVEDVHWADPETLALLRLLAPELGRTPLVVVLTARPAADDERATALAGLSGSASTQVVALGPLDVADVADYLVQGRHAGDAAAVLALSGGLPLLLPVAVGAAPGAGDDEGSGRQLVDVPTLVRRLTVSLRDEHVLVLESASLVASHLDAELAGAAADVELSVAGDATAAALRAGLLVRAADGRSLAFAHELVREALIVRLTPDRARAAHRRIAELGTTRAGVPAVRVAAHWEAAGPEAAAHAATWWSRAADESSALRAHADAAGHQARAAAAATLAGLPGAEVAPFHLGAARAWHRAGRYDEAVAAAEQASALASTAGRGDLVAEAALAVGWVSYPDAQAAIGRLTSAALDGPGPVDDATRARLVAQQVAALGNYAEARGAALTAEAMRLARRSQDPTALLAAIGAWMTSKPELGSATDERELAEEAVGLAVRVGQPLPELMAHTWRLNAVVQLGLMDLVNEELGALRRIAEESRLPLATWHWLRASVSVAVLRGDFAAVDERHRRATSIAQDSGDVVAANVSNAAVFEVALRRGVPLPDPEQTLLDLEQAPMSALVQAPRAIILDEVGRHDEARVIYQRLVPLLGSPPEYRPWWPLIYLLLELTERFHDTATGPRLVAELEPYARDAVGGVGTSTVWFIGNSNRQLGRALVLAGRLEDAVTAYRTAVSCDDRIGARPDVALGRLDIARTLARADWPTADRPGTLRAALADARLAAEECRGLDMPGHASRADVLVAELTRSLAADDPLSPREREVLDRVVEGLTNQEVAARLFLSERTVESHVRAALMKLGCRNRAELIRHEAAAGRGPAQVPKA